VLEEKWVTWNCTVQNPGMEATGHVKVNVLEKQNIERYSEVIKGFASIDGALYGSKDSAQRSEEPIYAQICRDLPLIKSRGQFLYCLH